MPTYEFRCSNGHTFDQFHKISDAPSEAICPICGALAERAISGGAGLVFKGSGFYLTDYGKNAHRGGTPAAKGEGSESGGGKGDAGGSKESGTGGTSGGGTSGGGSTTGGSTGGASTSGSSSPKESGGGSASGGGAAGGTGSKS